MQPTRREDAAAASASRSPTGRWQRPPNQQPGTGGTRWLGGAIQNPSASHRHSGHPASARRQQRRRAARSRQIPSRRETRPTARTTPPGVVPLHHRQGLCAGPAPPTRPGDEPARPSRTRPGDRVVRGSPRDPCPRNRPLGAGTPRAALQRRSCAGRCRSQLRLGGFRIVRGPRQPSNSSLAHSHTDSNKAPLASTDCSRRGVGPGPPERAHATADRQGRPRRRRSCPAWPAMGPPISGLGQPRRRTAPCQGVRQPRPTRQGQRPASRAGQRWRDPQGP